jgi:two-component system response regulator FixJ
MVPLVSMTNRTEQHIFLVDDEPSVREAVSEVLGEAGFKVRSFARAASCLEQLRFQMCDLLISDIKMPEMDGLELLTAVRQVAPWLPVLLITGYGDIPIAATAFKKGAADFIEKPLDRRTLISTIEHILMRISSPDPLHGKALTKTEMEVLRLILDGRTNKEIALTRRRSRRTIEDQRDHIMRKLGVNNIVDLIKRATLMGLVDLERDG